MEDDAPIYNVSSRTVHAYFRKATKRSAGAFSGGNPYGPHLLRVAFHTFLSDHKVDPLYMEYWMGNKLPDNYAPTSIRAEKVRVKPTKNKQNRG
jgi:hypothetical protein